MDLKGEKYHITTGLVLNKSRFIPSKKVPLFCSTTFISFYLIWFHVQGESFKDRATAMQCLLQRGDEPALEQVLLLPNSKCVDIG